MHVEDCERAFWVAVGDLNLFRRPVIVYTVDECDVLSHLLADLGRIGIVGPLVFPECRIYRAAILRERIHGSKVEWREVEEHEVSRADLVERIKLLVDTVDVVQQGKVNAIVGEERCRTNVIRPDPNCAVNIIVSNCNF